MKKKSYKISINWYGGIHTYYRDAVSDEHAVKLAIVELSEELKRSIKSVEYYVLSKNRYITMVIP